MKQPEAYSKTVHSRTQRPTFIVNDERPPASVSAHFFLAIRMMTLGKEWFGFVYLLVVRITPMMVVLG